MLRKSILLPLILALLLVSCAKATEEPSPVMTEESTPIKTEIPGEPYPQPAINLAPTWTPAYPEPGTLFGGSQMVLTVFAPLPSDSKLMRGNAYVDLPTSEIIISESEPMTVTVILRGNLPDPCHQLRVVVNPADEQKNINLEVYSVTDPNNICVTMLAPFEARVELGAYLTGHYKVLVNGELLGEFDR